MDNSALCLATTHMTPQIYRDFYKTYYKERLRCLTVITSIIGVVLAAAGAYIYKNDLGLIWCAISIWIGAVLLVYPRVAYRKPYKRAKDAKLTTRFAFYENHVSERTNSVTTDYSYKSLLKVIETGKYVLIYHSPDSVSIVDKAGVKGDAEGLCRLLASKTKHKKIKG